MADQNFRVRHGLEVGASNSTPTLYASDYKVGVGTDSPSGRLDVKGGDVYLSDDIYLAGGQSTYKAVNVISNDIYLAGRHLEAGYGLWVRSSGTANRVAGMDGFNNDLRLYSNATEKVRIKSNGNVGVGTDAPTETLHVNGTFKASSSIVAGTPAFTTHTLYGHTIIDRTGVNTNNPWLSIYSNGASVAYINGGGTFYGTGALLTIYLSLDPSFNTASTFIAAVPVLDINKPITICLLEVVLTTVVKELFAKLASA